MLEENRIFTPKQKRVSQENNTNFSLFNKSFFDSKSDQNQAHNINYESEKKHLQEKRTLSFQNIYIKTGWTSEQQEELYRLHDQIGNKWAVLANKIDGRTDNCVKNHFYSKLRKAMRKLNKYVHDFYRREFKEIKISAIYKIIQGNQEKHKAKTSIDKKTSDYCQDLKNRLLRFSDQDDELETYQQNPEVRKMIRQIVDFNRNYKRQNKRKRKGSGDTQWSKTDLKKKRKQSQQIYSSQQEDEDDNQPIINIYSKRRSIQKEQKKQYNKEALSNISNIEAYQNKQVSLLPIIPVMKNSASRVQMEEQQGIQNLLRTAGMMEDDHQMPMLFMKKDFSIISRFSGRPLSQNPADHDAFFDESELHHIGKSNGFNPFQYMREHHNDFE